MPHMSRQHEELERVKRACPTCGRSASDAREDMLKERDIGDKCKAPSCPYMNEAAWLQYGGD